jgi:hypothetical protein
MSRLPRGSLYVAIAISAFFLICLIVMFIGARDYIVL